MQFKLYVDGVAKSDCRAALRRYIEAGPPVWLAEPVALPVPEVGAFFFLGCCAHSCAALPGLICSCFLIMPDGQGHVVTHLWFEQSGEETSARLTGALEDAERDALWAEHKQIYEVLTEEPQAPTA